MRAATATTKVRSAPCKVQYKVLTPSLVSKSVDCIAVSFAQSKSKSADPFTEALNLRQSQWAVLSQMFVQRAAHKDLSVVAINPETDQVVGVHINEDWKQTPPDAYRDLHDWRPVRAIFNLLHTRFKANTQHIAEYGKVLHPLYFTCVRPEFQGQGIVSELWHKSLDIAKEMNYTEMVAEGGTKAAEHVLAKKLGFKEVAKVDFADFLFEGQKPFANLPKLGFDKLSIYQRPIVSDLYV